MKKTIVFQRLRVGLLALVAAAALLAGLAGGAAAANYAALGDWYNASIGHDACKGTSTRWSNPLVPTTLAAPIHPNKAGMVGGANALLAAVK